LKLLGDEDEELMQTSAKKQSKCIPA